MVQVLIRQPPVYSMTEVHKVKVTDPAHAALIAEWYGLARAEEALAEVKMGNLPGFALAAAIVARESADARTRAMSENLKAISRSGVDIVFTKNISLAHERGVPVLHVELLDLADMAEGQ